MSTTHFLLAGWTWNPPALVFGAAALGGYLVAFRRNGRPGWFVAALALFLLTLLSPLNALAEGYLFSAHMVQHIVLLLIVPALVLRSLPQSRSLAFGPRAPRRPFVGWAGGVGAMWLWHAPALCNAAVSHEWVRALQTASLLLLGGLFWRPILAPRDAERLSPPAAVLYLFSACLTCSVLGMVVTLSPVTVCSIYSVAPADRLGIGPALRDRWGFTPERDQQIGGLLMWVPMCLIYLLAIVAQIARWFAEPVFTAQVREDA